MKYESALFRYGGNLYQEGVVFRDHCPAVANRLEVYQRFSTYVKEKLSGRRLLQNVKRSRSTLSDVFTSPNCGGSGGTLVLGAEAGDLTRQVKVVRPSFSVSDPLLIAFIL